MKLLISAAMLLALLACSSAPEKKMIAAQVALPMTIEEAVNSPDRTLANTKRDLYRHPLQTLTFFGLKPEMTVVEIWPSGGWYTEILAPFLAAKGQYIVADPAKDPNGYTNPRKEWLAKHSHVAAKIITTTFQSPDSVAIAPAGTVDLILTFRNIHNWQPKSAQQAAFSAFFKALRPGGVLGVVEHRANTKIKFDSTNGYVLEKEVIKLALEAGFKLEAKSEINANPKDKADYPEGVWTLPPRLKLGEKDKEKYLAIGESDRMTLKFIRPVKE